MSDHRGLVWILLAIVLVVVSIFLDFAVGAMSGLEAITFLFTDYSTYFTMWGNIFQDFTLAFGSVGAFLTFSIILLAPMFLIIGTILMLCGLTGRTLAKIGAFLLIFVPLVYLICGVIYPVFTGGDITVTITYMQAGLYLQLIAAILGFVGASKNHRED